MKLDCSECGCEELEEIPKTYGSWDGDEFRVELRTTRTVRCLGCGEFMSVLLSYHGATVRFKEKDIAGML